MKKSKIFIEELAPGETKLQEVHKHWFGLVMVYIEVAIGFAAGVVLLWLVAPFAFANTDAALRQVYITEIVGLAGIFAWLLMVIFTYIYRQNRLIITDKNLTQILQRGLFSRQVSELSMSNVEDVTANQHGFFPTVLGYGELLVETAGAEDNFDFSFCPHPSAYGKIVLEARQNFIDANPNARRRN